MDSKKLETKKLCICGLIIFGIILFLYAFGNYEEGFARTKNPTASRSTSRDWLNERIKDIRQGWTPMPVFQKKELNRAIKNELFQNGVFLF